MKSVYYFAGDNILPSSQKRYVEQWDANVEDNGQTFLVSVLTKTALFGKYAVRKAKRRERMHLRFLKSH